MANSKSHNSAELRQLARQRLMSLKQFGIEEWAKPSGTYPFELVDSEPAAPSASAASKKRPAHPTLPTKTVAPVSDASPSRPVSDSPPSGPAGPLVSPSVNTGPYPTSLDLAARKASFQILRETVSDCKKCVELANRRTQTVFGEGNLRPRLVFLGEAPGGDEDSQGVPFVGRAGKLLTKIIEAMKLSREDVFILNTVKCRPPGNRNPSEVEIFNCANFLEQQLDVLQPEIICCLGFVAARVLLKTNDSIGRIRGRFYQYKASKVLVTYHPSYLLRTENETFRGKSPKSMVWEDMKLILSELKASEG